MTATERQARELTGIAYRVIAHNNAWRCAEDRSVAAQQDGDDDAAAEEYAIAKRHERATVALMEHADGYPQEARQLHAAEWRVAYW